MTVIYWITIGKENVRELRNLIERIAILQPDSKEKISNIVKES